MARRQSITRTFRYGLVTEIEKDSIKRGASSDSLNFITELDRVELCRGMKLLGTEVVGNGRISGLGVSFRPDGNNQMWITHGKKLKYYDRTTEDFIEISTDQLGTDADGEDISFSEYQSLAGYQMWLSSPNSSIYKIMTANPGDVIDVYDSTKNFKGNMTIHQNRMFLWNTENKDKTGVNISHIDKQNYDEYDTEVDEVIGTGNASEKTFSNTLVFKAAGAKRSCFLVTVTDDTETFNDNFDGTLTGDAGGTGTINYATGVISVTFKVAPAGAQDIKATYYWEDATSDGVADFQETATRVAGEGGVFRQDNGGPIRNIVPLEDTEYCFHEKQLWTLYLTNDDTNADNNIFREKVGLPYFLSAIPTGDGIYYVDNKDDKVRVRLLSISKLSTKVLPNDISPQLDLSDYDFSQAAGIEFSDYILISCKYDGSSFNNRVLIYNTQNKTWDIRDWFVSVFGVYDGSLVGGDSISNNCYLLFSGLDDDDATIAGHWTSWEDTLGMEGLKKFKKFIIEGQIGVNQKVSVDMKYDGGAWTEVGEIDGSASYVNKSQSIAIGATTLGSKEIGGGSGGITANHYVCPITVNSDRFRKVQFRFRVAGIGWFDFSSVNYYDTRKKQLNIPNKYRQ